MLNRLTHYKGTNFALLTLTALLLIFADSFGSAD